MFGSYSVCNIVVLLNMLIAMMSNSYQRISEKSDKYEHRLTKEGRICYIREYLKMWGWGNPPPPIALSMSVPSYLPHPPPFS